MKKFLLATVLAGTSLLSTQVSQAQTAPIYREVFGTSGVNSLLSTVGWVGAYGATATDSGTVSTSNFGLSSAVGSPTSLDNINAGGSATSTSTGFLYTSGGTWATANWIAYQSSYTVDTTANSINDISIYCGSAVNGATIPGFRIAVQIGGSWYASTAVLANTTSVSSAGNFAAGAQKETFTWTTAASAWDNLTFVPGTSLALGSTLSSSLPSGNITAFGLYSDAITGGSTRRVDTPQIDATAVPEPSSVALVLSGVGILMGFRRSRKA